MSAFQKWVEEQADADEREGIQRDRDAWRRLAWNAAIEAAARLMKGRNVSASEFYEREILKLKDAEGEEKA